MRLLSSDKARDVEGEFLQAEKKRKKPKQTSVWKTQYQWALENRYVDTSINPGFCTYKRVYVTDTDYHDIFHVKATRPNKVVN